jgi:sodium/bile acid cotransporter 7
MLWTRLAGGAEAVALLTIMLSTALSWLITTLWLTFATGAAVRPNTAELMTSLFLILLVPVGLGQMCRSVPLLTAAVTRYKALIGGVARLLIFSIILKAAVGLADRLEGLTPSILLITAATALGVHLTALYAGLWSSKAMGFPRADCIAVAFAGSQKTLPVSLFLFEAYFRDAYPLAVLPLVLYHVGQLVVDTFIADGLMGKLASMRPTAPSARPGGANVAAENANDF